MDEVPDPHEVIVKALARRRAETPEGIDVDELADVVLDALCLTPTTEATARRVAAASVVAPVSRWELPSPPDPVDDDEDDEDDPAEGF